jgi:hypothetical protein
MADWSTQFAPGVLEHIPFTLTPEEDIIIPAWLPQNKGFTVVGSGVSYNFDGNAPLQFDNRNIFK